MKRGPLAAIDVGTNTVRLLIGYEEEGRIDPCLVMRSITRLGGGFSPRTGISPAAQERTIAALGEFALKISAYRVSRVRAVATSAVRDAVNGAEFCRLVREQTGIDLEVIDGGTEGLLTVQGVQAALDEHAENLFVFDVGGGSTEYSLVRRGEVTFTRSLPIGVVRLTEGKESIAGMIDRIDRILLPLHDELAAAGYLMNLDNTVLVGTAGTATTLAAISQQLVEYDYRIVNNYVLPLTEIRSIFARLLPLSPEERLETIIGLEKGREDLIMAGILITVRTMEVFGFHQLKVSDFGLLEGVLLNVS